MNLKKTDSGWYVLECSYEERATPKKAGFWWNSKACPKAWATKEIEKAYLLRDYASDEIRTELEIAMKGKAERIEASRATTADIEIARPNGLEYRPFQRAGIAYALDRENTLIADEMGLGKTIQALGVVNATRPKNVLVICPASLRLNWIIEANKWLVHKYAIWEVKPKSRVPEEATFVVTNYERLDVDGLDRDWDLVVVDECQKVKNPKAKRTKRAIGFYDRETKAEVPGLVDRAKRKLFLTGTPILNRPIEMWPVVHKCDPKNFGSFFGFAKRYCGGTNNGYGWDFSGASNLDELQKKLRESFMVRRLKSEVLKELPAKQRQLVVLPANGCSRAVLNERKAWADYEGQLESLRADVEIAWASGNETSYQDAVAQLSKAAREAFTEISRIRHETALAKVPEFIEYAKETLDSAGKVIVFAHHLDVVELIRDGLADYNPVLCTGPMKPEDRQRSVEAFQTDDTVRVFIGTIGAAGVGLTLTAASTVLFAELDWVPGNMTQAEDRCLTGDNLVFCLESKSADSSVAKLKRIKDVVVGDYVITHSGSFKKVTDIYNREHRGMLTTIRYVGWPEPLVCTYDHKVLVKRDKMIDWVLASSILPSDSMAFPKSMCKNRLEYVFIKDSWRLYLNATKKTTCSYNNCDSIIEARGLCRIHYRELLKDKNRPQRPLQINSRYVRLPDKIEIDDEWLYLFGWYTAEGFSSLLPGKSKFVSFSGHAKERYILDRIARKLSSYGIKSNIYSSKTSKNSIELRAYSGELALWFRDWFGHTAKHKSLPKEIMGLPIEQAKIFLRGYVDGDGYRRNKSIEWVSASKTLSYQMCLLAIRCNYIPTMRRGSIASGNHWIGGYTKNETQSNSKLQEQNGEFVFRPVRSVLTENKKIKVYDLTVEDDHSFTTGLCTVHNCHRIGQLNSVNIVHVVLDGSLDQQIATTLIEKQEIADRALDVGAEIDLEAKAVVVPVAERSVPKPKKISEYAEEIRVVAMRAIRELASVCDGARDKDGFGFNGVDAQIGHSLAEQQSFSDRQTWLALKITRKYRKQLERYLGADFPKLQEAWSI